MFSDSIYNFYATISTYNCQILLNQQKIRQLSGNEHVSFNNSVYAIGDAHDPFCLQSMIKPLTYAMVLDELGPDVVHQYVGQEPSGQAFNNIRLDPMSRWGFRAIDDAKRFKHEETAKYLESYMNNQATFQQTAQSTAGAKKKS